MKTIYLQIKLLAFLIFAFGLGQNSYGQTYVTNTNDAGPGSLREAVTTATPGTTILFDPGIANQTIPLSSVISITTQLTIDGQGNNITISGGGSTKIFNISGAGNVALFNLTITQGQGSTGGAIGSTGSCNLTAEFVFFVNNSSSNDGGAIRITGGTQTFRNCSFIGNDAPFWGGAYYQLTGTVNFENCLFSGNRADRAGAIFLRGNSTFVGCTFTGNYATSAIGGGVFHIWSGASVQVFNSIVWNNQCGGIVGDQTAFYTMESGSPTLLAIEKSLIQGSGGSGSWNGGFGNNNGGNLDGNPNFALQIAPTSAPTTAGNYRPQPPSIVLDSGLGLLSSSSTELDGHGRIMNGEIDMGCYEFCTTYSTISPTACDTYMSPGGNTYNASGVYYDTLMNYLGCDSVITINLTIDQTAVVNAGVNQIICANNPTVNLSGTVTNAGGGQWSSSGTGSFGSLTALNTTYSPSGADILAGNVTITLLSTGNGSCAAQSDDLVITFSPAPTATAGPDVTVCADNPNIALSGSVTVATGGDWTSTGTGAFSPSSSTLNATYIPSAADLISGSVVLTLTTTGNGSCNPVVDNLTVTFIASPIVNAGADQTVCEGTAVTLVGSGADSYTWDNSVIDGSPFTPAVGVVTYTVTGTDTNGCMATDQAIVTVNALPTVTFTGAFPILCENDAVYTMSQGSPGGGVYSGTGVVGNTFDPGSALSGTHPITYTYTDGNSCTDFATQNILVNAIPNVVATGTSPICEGSSTNIAATGANAYSWDNGIGPGQTHIVSPTVTTTYVVTGTAMNTCTNTDSVTININPLPNVTFGPLSPLCLDGPPYTLVEGSPAGGNYSGPGVSAGVIDQLVAGIGIHTIYYDFTDINGCYNIDSSDIEIYASPTIVATATSTNLCDGDLLTLTGSGANSYSWNNGVSDGISFAPAVGNYNYIVTGFDLNGCSGTDSVFVTVNTLPTVSAGTDQTVCDGVQVTLSGAGAVSYLWDNGVQNGVAFLPPPGLTTYTVVGTDANGCENYDLVDVTVNPNPVLTVSPDQIFCLGDNITLTVSGADTYNWDSGAASSATYQITPNASVTVNVIGYNTFNCQATASIDLTLDDPNLVDAGADQTICEGFTANLSATGGVDYFWNGPGFVNENNQDISFSVDTTAFYTVMITTTNGCVYPDSVLVSISTDPACTIETVSSITPNNDGINDFWKIQGIEGFPDNHVVIYNRWGDIVFDENGYDNDLIKWDGMRNDKVLGAGTYFYLIEITNGPAQSGWIQLMK